MVLGIRETLVRRCSFVQVSPQMKSEFLAGNHGNLLPAKTEMCLLFEALSVVDKMRIRAGGSVSLLSITFALGAIT